MIITWFISFLLQMDTWLSHLFLCVCVHICIFMCAYRYVHVCVHSCSMEHSGNG